MRVMRKAGAGLAALALTTMATVPAMADPGRGRDRGGQHDRDRDRHHKDDDGDAVGGFVLGALLAGGLVAALAGKKKEPKPLPQDVAFVPVAATGVPAGAPTQADEEAAVSACVASAEDQARRQFPVAQVAQVGAVEPVGTGFAIRGDLTVRGSYREAGERHGFRCRVDAEAVNEVSVDGLPQVLAAR